MKKIDQKQIEMAMLPEGTATFATVLEQIEAAPDLAAVRRRDMISGLRRVAKALGRSPEELPADPKWLQPRLSRVAPAALRLTVKSWQNAVSDARAALAHVGIVKRRRRHIDGLATSWRELWRAVLALGEHNLTARLRRFVHFLDGLDLAPDAVTQAHAEAFLVALKADEIAKRPEESWRLAIGAWNLAAARIEGWPQMRLVSPPRQNVIKRPDHALPQAFVADLAELAQRLAKPDPFAEDGPARALRPQTLLQHERMLKRFASELLDAGVPEAEIDAVAALCDPARAELGLRAMVARNGNATGVVIADMAILLHGYARKLKLSEEVLRRLAYLARRVAMPPRNGMTRKNRERLRVLRDEATLRRLLELPDRLEAMGPRLKPPQAALAREVALAIAILLACPLRIGNIAGIHIDRHLHRPGDGRVFLVIEEEEVKNACPMEFELPPELRRMLDRHLARRSPLLCPGGTPWLFPRRDGTGPVNKSTLSTRLAQRIRKETGIVMNAHLFRHLAAMLYLDANPGAYEAVRRLLGHSSVSSTINFYAGLETRSALAAYGGVLAGKKGRK